MLHQLEFRAMGTDMLVGVDNGMDIPPAELSQVSAWFEEWEQTLSRFRLGSELSQLNRAMGQPFSVSETMWQVFQSAAEMEAFTGGLVTPAVGNAMREIGYDRDFPLLAGQNLPALNFAPAPLDSVGQVSCDESTRAIFLSDGATLDFGGIAKGWAAEETVRRLKRHGSVLMNCGGDIAMSGALLDGSPWQVGVYQPFDRASDYIAMLFFESACGVATSSTDRRYWRQGSALRHHIIDPRLGASAESDVISATVIAPTAVQAEAAAKAALILGSRSGLDWIEATPGLAALLILNNGALLGSSNLTPFLRISLPELEKNV